MKRSLLVPLGLAFLGAVGFVGCPAPVETTPATSGGAVGTSGGSVGTSGGSVGTSGGSVGTSGGSVGTTGGSVGTTGGSVGTTGGSTGTGGRGTGGAGGAVGGTTGTGGRGTGGAVGGTTGTGGRGTGGAGTGGAGTGGASGALPTIPELFPPTATLGSLDGRLLVMPCNEANTAGTDCASGGGYYSTAGAGTTATRIACAGGAFTLQQDFAVGGEPNRQYNVTIHFYGVAEPKNYGTGLTREAGTARPAATPTGAGATPTPWAEAAGGHTFPVSAYNTNEIHVRNMAGVEQRVYYLNADTSEGHWSYVMNYEKNIVVYGGGTVRVRNYDQNCREIKNCGPNGTAATACAAASNARVVNVSAAMPTPANAGAASGGLLQPGLVPERDAGSAGQWLLIDVVRVNSVM